jgi:hypothetical protein
VVANGEHASDPSEALRIDECLRHGRASRLRSHDRHRVLVDERRRLKKVEEQFRGLVDAEGRRERGV